MQLKLDGQGLIPTVAQDINTGQVLMVGYMNPGALKRTMEGGQVWYYSRSREDLWHKGEVSGNYMNVKEVWADCDADTLLLKVEPEGPICHTGEYSCFLNKIDEPPETTDFFRGDIGSGTIDEIWAIIQERIKDMPAESYTANLVRSGIGKVAQKVTEEAGETAIAAAMGDKDQLPEEISDLLYHTLVLMAASNIKPKQIWDILRSRIKK
jgi:phosphoribosyl-ATP pyrophosphohydrolase/phosphoribosyl-AMP cyclohydrolase